ncbi:hypothetical protein LEMLEM_LOCUS5426 [Lemmus lemmus]
MAGGEHQENRGQVENTRRTGDRWRTPGEQGAGGEHQGKRWQVENTWQENTRTIGGRW